MNLHDFLIEGMTIGPRRELHIYLLTPINERYGELIFSTVENYPVVEDWVQDNEEELDAVRKGRFLLRVESSKEQHLRSNVYEYRIEIDHLNPLLVVSRRARIKQ
jgi:hypothetical protein